MGLSRLPGLSEGMLCIILVNTALSISMFKGIVRSVLHLVGIIRLSPSSVPASSEIPTTETFDIRVCQPESFLEEFRNTIPTLKFESLCRCKKHADEECSVCLSKFKEDSEVNKLKCGHLFHKACLEKWIDYWNRRTALAPCVGLLLLLWQQKTSRFLLMFGDYFFFV